MSFSANKAKLREYVYLSIVSNVSQTRKEHMYCYGLLKDA
jgi:hypothetical protein